MAGVPRWRSAAPLARNGKELFYISPDSKMMAVEVSTQPVFQSGTPQPLFQTDIVDTEVVRVCSRIEIRHIRHIVLR